MEEFFGIGGFKREPEGFLSWQHLLFVGTAIAIMVVLAIVFGNRNKNKSEKTKNIPLIVAAIVIDGFEILKWIAECLIAQSFEPLFYDLPLFLCSIQLFALPVAAFAKGKIKEIGLDFVFIFGLLCATMGTIAAGNDYSSYPVISFHNICSTITHCSSGFGCLYVGIVGKMSMKKENLIWELLVFAVFCAVAYVANILLDYNYMFLMRGDGTPYDLFYNLVDGNPVLYPTLVVGTLLIYILAFFGIYKLFEKQYLRSLKDKKINSSNRSGISQNNK